MQKYCTSAPSGKFCYNDLGAPNHMTELNSLLHGHIKPEHLLRVVPVIGILTDRQAFKPIPNAAEVEAIFDAPLEMFLKDENRTAEEREWMGNKYLVHFFDFKEENKEFLIWGLTAGILIRAASVVYQRPPAFLEQKPNFKLPRVLDKDTTMH